MFPRRRPRLTAFLAVNASQFAAAATIHFLVDLPSLKALLLDVPHGKRVNNALYFHRDSIGRVPAALAALIDTLAAAYAIPPEFNLLKFRLDELKVSFLLYPEFFGLAHPALREAVTIDLATGKSRATDYSRQANPPVLHRKETFLPADHEFAPTFAALTTAEEAAGLLRAYRVDWFLAELGASFLRKKGRRIDGHTLLTTATIDESPVDAVQIDRHKTALTRSDFSKPAKSLLQHGLLTKDL